MSKISLLGMIMIGVVVCAGGEAPQNDIMLSPGLVLRQIKTDLIYYEGFIPLEFPVRFSLSPKHDTLFEKYSTFCPELDVTCGIIRALQATLKNIDDRIISLSNSSVFGSENIDTFHYSAQVPTTDIPDLRAADSSEERSLGYNSIPNSTTPAPAQNRNGRQVVLLALVFGAIIYSTWFSSSQQDYTPVVTELRQRIDVTQQTLLDSIASVKKYERLEAQHLTEFADHVTQDLRTISSQNSNLGHLVNRNTKQEIKHLLLFHYFSNIIARWIELYQFQLGMDSCRNNVLPNTIVSPDELKASLLNLQKNLNTKNFTLSISPFHLSRYYSLQITRCAVNTRHNSVTVFLNVPIIPKDTMYSVHEAIVLPFLKTGNLICSLPSYPHYILKINDQFVPFSENSKSCNHDSNLCNISPHYIKNYLHEYECLAQLLDGIQLKQLAKVCVHTCTPFKNNSVIVKEIEPRQYLIATNIQGLKIICSSMTLPQRKIPTLTHQVGVHHLHLPCDCRVVDPSSTVIIKESIPCFDSVPRPTAHLLLPPTWVSSKAEQTFNLPLTTDLINGNKYQNLSTILNPIVFQPPTDPQTNTSLVYPWTSKLMEYHQLIPTYAVVLWNFAITVAVSYLIYKSTSVPIPGFIPVSHGAPVNVISNVETTLTEVCNPIPALLRHHLVIAIVIISLIVLFSCSSCICIFCASRRKAYMLQCVRPPASSEIELQTLPSKRQNQERATATINKNFARPPDRYAPPPEKFNELLAASAPLMP